MWWPLLEKKEKQTKKERKKGRKKEKRERERKKERHESGRVARLDAYCSAS